MQVFFFLQVLSVQNGPQVKQNVGMLGGGGLRQKLILTEGRQGEHHSACYLGFELGLGVFFGLWCVHFQCFLVHLSRRLKCTIVITRCPSSVRLSVVRPSLTFHIFDFFSETAKRNSTKLDRKQDLNVLYEVCVLRADRKNKMAALASDWLIHFRLLL